MSQTELDGYMRGRASRQDEIDRLTRELEEFRKIALDYCEDAAEAIKRAQRAEEYAVQLREFIEDLRDHGVRFDMNPTLDHHPDRVAFSYLAYIRRIDESVRERADAALAKNPEAQCGGSGSLTATPRPSTAHPLAAGHKPEKQFDGGPSASGPASQPEPRTPAVPGVGVSWADGMERAAELCEEEAHSAQALLNEAPNIGHMAKDRMAGVRNAMTLMAKTIRTFKSAGPDGDGVSVFHPGPLICRVCAKPVSGEGVTEDGGETWAHLACMKLPSPFNSEKP